MEPDRLTPTLLDRIRSEVRRIAPAQEVDDLCQEACVRLIEKEELWHAERGAYSTWARTVARNLTIGRLAKRRQATSEYGVVAMDTSTADLPHDLSEERIAFVLSEFTKLGEEDRRILSWRYLDGRSVTDIAAELGVSQPAVSQRIAKALTELRRRAKRRGLVGVGGIASAAALTAVAVTSAWFLQDPEARVVGNTADLEHTRFTPALETALDPARNTLWCATAPLAWDALTAFVGGPLVYERPSPLLDALQSSSFPRESLDERSFVADAGLTGEGTVERIQDELMDDFDQGRDPFLDQLARNAGPGQLLAYAFLFKELRWPAEFDDMDDYGLEFHWRAEAEQQRSPVRCFGVSHLRASSDRKHEKIAEQVRVWQRDTDTFVVGLGGQQQKDQVLLARIDPGETLAKSVQRALELCEGPGDRLDDGDTLLAPVIDFDLSQEWPELCGTLTEGAYAGRSIGLALQTIRFRLDHEGAVVKSRMVAVGLATGTEPRQLLFDRPFLVLMRERGKAPYAAFWIGTPELMVPYVETD